MNLSDLKYRFSPAGFRGQHNLAFLCPKCRKHEIAVAVWRGPAGREILNPPGAINSDVAERVWHFEGDEEPGWSGRITVTPSIDCTVQGWACGGWHGFITNGEVNP